METQIHAFMDALASKAPTPGGGGAAALCGSLSAALASMVTNLTVGKKRYAAYEDELQSILSQTEAFRMEILSFVDLDAEAFAPLAAAYGIPKDTEGREETLETALHAAAGVPADLVAALSKLPPILDRLTVIGSRLAVSDVGCSATLCRAAAESAALNVYINTKLMTDRQYAEKLNVLTADTLNNIRESTDAVYEKVSRKVKGEAK